MLSLGPQMRQRLRNPSGKFALVVGLIALAIIGGALTPIIMVGIDNYQEVSRLRQREFAQPPGAWVRPWLVDKARIMIDAQQPIHWRPTDFVFGPCHAENISLLPNKEFREAIQYSCGEFHRIQMAYAADCASTNNCLIPESAKLELRAVIAVLDDAFDEAGFVQPVVEEQTAR
jgi:hypothetical protein